MSVYESSKLYPNIEPSAPEDQTQLYRMKKD